MLMNLCSVNDNFIANDKDVAIIKIEENNLPTLAIGNSSSLSVGSKIATIGFPASADFNGKNLMEATLSFGSIGAIKDSQNKDFKIFQSDAKISQGSSGSPMLNDQGEVTGVMTYQATDTQRSVGDNFAYALPINEAKKWITDFVLKQDPILSGISTSEYSGHFKKGLLFLENQRGKKACAEFQAAADSSIKFSSVKYINPYIEKCNTLVSSGKSVDSLWDEKKSQINKIKGITIGFSVGAFLLVLIIIIVVFILAKRLKKSETEYTHLRNIYLMSRKIFTRKHQHQMTQIQIQPLRCNR